MGLDNFRESIKLLLKLKESLIPQADGNFITNWEIEARKYQYTSEHVLMELKEDRYTEGFVSAITSQLYYLRDSLSNYDFMPDSEKDKFKRLYVLAALGLIAKLKLILFFSTLINSNNNVSYIRDLNLNNSYSSKDYNTNYATDDDFIKGDAFANNSQSISTTCCSISCHNMNNSDDTSNSNVNREQAGINVYNDYNFCCNQNNYDNTIDIENHESERDDSVNTSPIYKDYMSQYVPYITQYATSTLADEDIHECAPQVDMREAAENVQHEHLLNVKNWSTSNGPITKNVVNPNLKDSFLVCQQPTLDTESPYYGNEQINNLDDSMLSNMYAHDTVKTGTESAAQHIYEILIQMQPEYGTTSSSASSTASSANNTASPNYNANCYVSNSMYYQPNYEMGDIRQMPQCLKVANLSDNMYGSDTYY